jgi:hypothetical protein
MPTGAHDPRMGTAMSAKPAGRETAGGFQNCRFSTRYCSVNTLPSLTEQVTPLTSIPRTSTCLPPNTLV